MSIQPHPFDKYDRENEYRADENYRIPKFHKFVCESDGHEKCHNAEDNSSPLCVRPGDYRPPEMSHTITAESAR
jgi:hypothetical protein